MRLILITILLEAASLLSLGQNIKRKELHMQALTDIYQFNFSNSESKIKNLPSDEQSIKNLLELFYWRWKEVPVAYSNKSDAYLQLLNNSWDLLQKHTNHTPQLMYYKISTALFLSEYYFSMGQNWLALKYAQKIYPLITEAIDKSYTEPELLFAQGMYHYYIEYYRKKSLFYRAAFIAFRSGDQQEGLKLLHRVSIMPSMAQTESKIFLAHIYMHMENKPLSALAFTEALVNDYPDNLKFHELYAENLIQCKQFEMALPSINKLIASSSFYFQCPGYFFKGIVEEIHFKNDLTAQRNYKECLKQDYKPVSRYQKLAKDRLEK